MNRFYLGREVRMRKIYFTKRKMYEGFKKLKISYIYDKKLLHSRIYVEVKRKKYLRKKNQLKY